MRSSWKLISIPCLRNYMWTTRPIKPSQKTSHMSPYFKVNEYLKFAKPMIVYSLLEFFGIVLSKLSLLTYSNFLSPDGQENLLLSFNFICINWKSFSILGEFTLTKKVCSIIVSTSVQSVKCLPFWIFMQSGNQTTEWTKV